MSSDELKERTGVPGLELRRGVSDKRRDDGDLIGVETRFIVAWTRIGATNDYFRVAVGG